MNRSHAFHPCLAAFRPWPFGPPLRGRSPRGEAGVPAALRRTNQAVCPQSSRSRPNAKATAPVGGLAWTHPIYST